MKSSPDGRGAKEGGAGGGKSGGGNNKKESLEVISDNEEDVQGSSQSQMQQGVTDTVWKVGCYKINPSTPSGEH